MIVDTPTDVRPVFGSESAFVERQYLATYARRIRTKSTLILLISLDHLFDLKIWLIIFTTSSRVRSSLPIVLVLSVTFLPTGIGPSLLGVSGRTLFEQMPCREEGIHIEKRCALISLVSAIPTLLMSDHVICSSLILYGGCSSCWVQYVDLSSTCVLFLVHRHYNVSTVPVCWRAGVLVLGMWSVSYDFAVRVRVLVMLSRHRIAIPWRN